MCHHKIAFWFIKIEDNLSILICNLDIHAIEHAIQHLTIHLSSQIFELNLFLKFAYLGIQTNL